MKLNHGFSIIESVVGISILSAVAVGGVFLTKNVLSMKTAANQSQLALTLEDQFLSGLRSQSNYPYDDVDEISPQHPTLTTAALLRRGIATDLPTIALPITAADASGETTSFGLSPSAGGPAYFDINLKPTTEASSTQPWVVALEAQYKFFAHAAVIDPKKDPWSYFVAYRIFFNPKLGVGQKEIGRKSAATFSDVDFILPISKDMYSRRFNDMRESFKVCTSEGRPKVLGIAGIDKSNKTVICIYDTPNDCEDDNPLVSDGGQRHLTKNIYLTDRLESEGGGYNLNYSCKMKNNYVCAGGMQYVVESYNTWSYFKEGPKKNTPMWTSEVTGLSFDDGNCVVRYKHEAPCTNPASACGLTVGAGAANIPFSKAQGTPTPTTYRVCPHYYATDKSVTDLCTLPNPLLTPAAVEDRRGTVDAGWTENTTPVEDSDSPHYDSNCTDGGASGGTSVANCGQRIYANCTANCVWPAAAACNVLPCGISGPACAPAGCDSPPPTCQVASCRYSTQYFTGNYVQACCGITQTYHPEHTGWTHHTATINCCAGASMQCENECRFVGQFKVAPRGCFGGNTCQDKDQIDIWAKLVGDYVPPTPNNDCDVSNFTASPVTSLPLYGGASAQEPAPANNNVPGQVDCKLNCAGKEQAILGGLPCTWDNYNAEQKLERTPFN